MDKKQRNAIIAAVVLLIIAVICLFLMHLQLSETARRANAVEQQLTATLAELQSLEAHAVQLETDIAAVQQQLTGAQTALSEAQQRSETLTAEKAELQAKLDALTAEKAALQQHLDALIAEHADLQAQYDALAAENAGLQAQYDALSAENTGLQAQHDALAAEKADGDSDESEIPAEVPAVPQADVIADLQARLNDADARIAALTDELAALQKASAANESDEEPMCLPDACPTRIAIENDAVHLSVKNTAQSGQTMSVSLYAGDTLLGEQTYAAGETPAALMLSQTPDSSCEGTLVCSVKDADGNVIYNTRYLVLLDAE